MLASSRTIEDWMDRLQGKSLQFLTNQISPYINGYNGREYDVAIRNLIRMKLDAGETIEVYRPMYSATLPEA